MIMGMGWDGDDMGMRWGWKGGGMGMGWAWDCNELGMGEGNGVGMHAHNDTRIFQCYEYY